MPKDNIETSPKVLRFNVKSPMSDSLFFDGKNNPRSHCY